jgi:Bacterial SH3 domain
MDSKVMCRGAAKKTFFVALFSLVMYGSFAQLPAKDMYVAYSTGLNIRKTPSLKAELLGKIPYGTKLKVEEAKKDTVLVTVEGMQGYWVPVTYQNMKGYILDCYLVSIVPPKKGTANLLDYIKQLTTPFGSALVVKTGTQNNITENGFETKKQLYKNGISWHQYNAYEYNANSYFIPNLITREAFLIIRQIKEFENAFTEKDEFPTASKKFTKKIRGYDAEYTLKVDVEDFGPTKWVKGFNLSFDEGAYSNFSIIQLETGEICISYSSGL